MNGVMNFIIVGATMNVHRQKQRHITVIVKTKMIDTKMMSGMSQLALSSN